MPFVKFQTSPKSNGNTGSCAQAINYFAKEDKDRDPSEPSHGFFTADGQNLSAETAQSTIEHAKYSQGLKKDESKFYHVMISFSEKELEGKTDQELIEFTKDHFADAYLDAGQRAQTSASELIWCAKLEHTRKYKGDDPKVQENAKKSGQIKEGDNRHIHVVVARKTQNNRKISPLSNHFKKGTDKGAVKGGFDQAIFKTTLEMNFDDNFSHKRQKEDYVSEKLQAYRPDLFKHQNMFDTFLGQVQNKIKQIQAKSIPKAEEIQKKVKRFIYSISHTAIQKLNTLSNHLNQSKNKPFMQKRLTEIYQTNTKTREDIQEALKLQKDLKTASTRIRPGEKKPPGIKPQETAPKQPTLTMAERLKNSKNRGMSM
jgi:hypothetical protein